MGFLGFGVRVPSRESIRILLGFRALGFGFV